MNSIPSMLEYILQQQGRSSMTPEEASLLSASNGVAPPVQVAANDPAKGSWLRSLFSRGQQPPQPQQPQQPQNPTDNIGGPGSIADQIRQRRQEADQAGKELSYAPEDMVAPQQQASGADVNMRPQDMMLAAAPSGTMNDADPYGGVSMQTRAALAKAGAEDVHGDLGDMAIGAQRAAAPAAGGYAAKTTVRGAQTSAQEDKLVQMLMSRGMSEKDARARAKSIK